MWNMFHCFVKMKVLLRLLTILCNILELSILKFVIISFEITLPKGTLILSMFAPISNWRIYSPNCLMRKYFVGWELNWTSLMLQTWSRNSIWIHARHEPLTNPWYFFHDAIYMSWIYLHPCMLSNPCRYLDESKSMRLQLTHILSNFYITKSLHNGGWRQGRTKPFKHILWKNSILSLMIVILDTQVLFLAKLTHVGRWTQTPPHKFDYMIKINTTTQGMLFHLREALLQVMG